MLSSRILLAACDIDVAGHSGGRPDAARQRAAAGGPVQHSRPDAAGPDQSGQPGPGARADPGSLGRPGRPGARAGRRRRADPGARRPRRRPARPRRRRRCPAPAGGRRPADPVRAAGPAAGAACRRPARRPVILTIAPVLREAGQRRRRSSRRPISITSDASPACRRRTSGCRTTRRPRSGCASDFRSLWATNFLDDLSIEVTDYTFPNGVIGKLVKYDIEERQRIKIVDYTGSKQLESTKIDEKLKEENVTIRLDSFVDDAPDPPRQGDRQGHAVREGLSRQHGDPRHHAGHRRHQDREPDVHDHRGPEVQDPQDRLRRQQGRSATASCAGR